MNSVKINHIMNLNNVTKNDFKGVFASNHLPKNVVKKPSFYIANTDPSYKPGQQVFQKINQLNTFALLVNHPSSLLYHFYIEILHHIYVTQTVFKVNSQFFVDIFAVYSFILDVKI